MQEAAAYLSTTVPAIRRLIHKQELPFTKLGKRFIIDRQDLDKWIERSKHTAMSFIIREKESENPFYFSDSGWTQERTEATQIPTLKEALEICDAFYNEADWDGETKYEVVDPNMQVLHRGN